MPIKFLAYDYDNTLGLTEKLAFGACCAVVNEVLARKGVEKRFTPGELMSRSVGRSFLGIITELAGEHNFSFGDGELDRLVLEEQNRVIEVLSAQMEPTDGVNEHLQEVQGKFGLAVVSSSALRRLRACLKAAGQEAFFPADHVFSAADSLPVPTSKPDPAIYLHALKTLGADASETVAIEDSRSGVLAAVRAGITVVGYVGSYPEEERAEASQTLIEAGASFVISNWGDLLPGLTAKGLLAA